VLVVDWTIPAGENRAYRNKVQPYWNETINAWINETGRSATYESSRDYLYANSSTGFVQFLKRLLSYKIAIMYQDAAVSCAWSVNAARREQVFTALQTGTFVWTNARVPLGNFGFGSAGGVTNAPPDYQYFFGVERTYYSGWSGYALYSLGNTRVEHFEGTLSLQPTVWPELAIDTAYLHDRYEWVPGLFYGYRGDLGALPEVGWCERTFDSEVIYLFKSMYGPEHGILTELSYHGRPVAHRLNRGLFRTVHWMFTPVALEQATAQVAINRTMNWLWDGRQALEASGRADGGAGRGSSALSQDLAARYWQCYWQANGDKDLFYELLENAY
jgi:hypothetical protein